MQIKLEGVMETLLIPLAARVHETKSENPRIRDWKAVEIAGKIENDFSKFDETGSRQGVIARTMILDREAQEFVDRYPDATCISIGCGLDTRYQRIQPRNITWYNLDFPEVIQIRKQVLEEGEQVKYIGKSALDSSWTDEVENNENVLIILEGILMYFTEDEVKQLLEMIKNKFPRCTVLVEIMNPMVTTKTKYHDTVKKTSAVFKWGVESGKAMEQLCSGIHFVKEWNLFDELKDQGLLFKIAAAVPFIKNINNKIVKLHME